MARWIPWAVALLLLSLAWQNRGTHASSACYRMVSPFLPFDTKIDLIRRNWQTIDLDSPLLERELVLKPWIRFCSGLAADAAGS